VKKEYFGRLIKNSEMMKLNFSNSFLDELCLKMKEVTLSPDEILYSTGQIDRRLIFINKGIIEDYVLLNKNKKVIKTNHSNDIIGYKQFFTDLPRDYNGISIGVT
jgi:CRP-like cAMP-binding protein